MNPEEKQTLIKEENIEIKLSIKRFSNDKLFIIFVVLFAILASMFLTKEMNTSFAKPVIYLYPTSKEQVKVELDFKGNIIADYPSYDKAQKGWIVTASPDGTIIGSDNKVYSYLFWEGDSNINPNYDLTTGFIVRGEDTKDFLQNILPKFGLTPKEYNEFIVYWYPLMKNNSHNLIHFAGNEYTNIAPLTITPAPDSLLRVFMVFKPLDKVVDIKPQEIKPFIRKGFTVVEWGGTELK